MSRNRLPESVTLPQVNSYTDDIILGSLGSPLGFDQDRLLVNLRCIDRFRTAAGFDKIVTISRDGPAEQAEAVINGLGPDATTTLVSLGKRPKNKLANGSVQYKKQRGSLMELPDATVLVNVSELDSRIEDSDKNVYDPVLRAKFLNQSIRRGLFQASFAASFSPGDCLLSATMYGLAAAEYGVPNLTWAYLGTGASIAFGALNIHRRLNTGENFSDALKMQRPSLFFGVTPDRYVASAGILAFSRVIKARQ